MALPDPTTWTYDLYSRLPDDGRRHEILGGEHFVTPAPSTAHQKLVRRLVFAIESVAADGTVGEVLAAPCDLYLSETDTVQPDLLYVSKERAEIVRKSRVEGAPDLVVEVLSLATRAFDEGEKRALYERFGVREYWLVDSESESVRILRHDGTRFVETESTDGPLETDLLPDLALELSTLFPKT